MDKTTMTRVKTAISAAAVVFPILIWGGNWGLFLLSIPVLILGTWELTTMLERPERRFSTIVHNSLNGVFWLCLFHFSNFFESELFAILCLLFLWIFSICLSLVAFWQFLTTGKATIITSMIGAVGTAFWLVAGLAGVLIIRNAPHGFLWLWYLLLTVWLTDCGAYVAGRTWGKKKMAPTISPGKTWIGTIGGMLTATIGGTAFGLATDLPLSISLLIFLSFEISFLAIIGDVFESLLKRTAGIKDSGTLLPGHGGVLDRLDSILYASPFLAFFLFLIN